MVATALHLFRNPVFVRALPFAVFVVFIAASGPLHALGGSIGMDPRWWYAVRILAVGALLAWWWPAYVELRPSAEAGWVNWLWAMVAGVVVFALWTQLNFSPLTLGSGPGYDPRAPNGAIDWRLAGVRLAGAALVVPLMEEIFWRSFAMRWVQAHDFLKVEPGRVGLRALGFSALVFGVEHHLWFAGVLAGLAYGWLYIRAGNLWVPIASHALTNALLGAWVLCTGRWEFW